MFRKKVKNLYLFELRQVVNEDFNSSSITVTHSHVFKGYAIGKRDPYDRDTFYDIFNGTEYSRHSFLTRKGDFIAYNPKPLSYKLRAKKISKRQLAEFIEYANEQKLKQLRR